MANNGYQRAVAVQPDDAWRCAWNADGMRCGYPGAITDSTLGSDRWFCGVHFKKPGFELGAEHVRASQSYKPPSEKKETHYGSHDPNDPEVKAARDRCMATVAKLGTLFGKPSNAWAHKILERHESGDTMPADSLRMARNALRFETGEKV